MNKIIQHFSTSINKKIQNQIVSFLSDNIDRKVNIIFIGNISENIEILEIRYVDNNIWIKTENTIEYKKKESLLNKVKKWLKI